MKTSTGPITISINGPDNVGKTTQLDNLPESFDLRFSIHNYDKFMTTLVTEDTLQQWWFKKCTSEEFVSVIMRAINQRFVEPSSKDFVAYDRGGVMFEAVCIATIAMKENCDRNKAESIYQSIKDKFGFKIVTEDVRILLKHGDTIEKSVEISLMRQSSRDQTYEDYQKILQQQLSIQESANMYTDVINVTDMSIVEVQNKIRSIVHKYSVNKHLSSPSLPLMFEHVNAIVAFGGLSESGKSSLAEGICNRLDVAGTKCARLKIGYFLKLASAQLGCDVYELSSEKQASLLVKQLNDYLKSHYWIRAITIESLHDLESTKALKVILGNLLQVVFVDTTLNNRILRSCTDIEELKIKDEVKMSRGAHKIKTDVACFIHDNNDVTLDESTHRIYDMVKSKSEKISMQALVNHGYTNKVDLFSQEFVLSAGSILINKSTKQVCLIHHIAKNEWLLPKGRKNVNENLSETALRETYEETGYECSLMPVTMETRATPGDEFVKDVARKVNDATEPFIISIRKIGSSQKNQKIIFWYITQINEDVARDANTQMENENFEVKLFSLEEANKVLAYEEDKSLIRQAFELFDNTYKQ